MPRHLESLAEGLHRRRVATRRRCQSGTTSTSNSWSSLRGRSSKARGMDLRSGTCPPASTRRSRRASRCQGHSRSPRPGHPRSRTPTCRTARPARSPSGSILAWSRRRRQTRSRHPIPFSDTPTSGLAPSGSPRRRRTTPSRHARGRRPFGRYAGSFATLASAGHGRPRRQVCCRSRIASRARRLDRRR